MTTTKKRTYDWSHFLSEDSDEEDQMIKLAPLDTSLVWIAKQVPLAQPPSLMDKCAKSLALYWTEHDQVAQQSLDMGPMFSVQVGLYLKGLALWTMIDAQQGLMALALSCLSMVFQRFLIHVMDESQRFERPKRIREALTQSLNDFFSVVHQHSHIHFSMHRLGITKKLNQPWALEGKMQDYFQIMAMGHSHRWDKQLFHLPYPLPPVLRIDPSVTSHKVFLYFPWGEKAQRVHNQWLAFCSEKEREAELKGLVLSKFTAERFDQDGPFPDLDPSKRHLLCIHAMARNYYQGASHITLVMGCLALVEPYYRVAPVGLDPSDLVVQRRQDFRFDIFFYLSQALAHLYANLDLPWACVMMAKKCHGPLVSISEDMRHAIMVQSILVSYGHWQSATTLFYEWIHRMPCFSWMFEELVRVHAKCIFSQVEDALIEMWMTKEIHSQCVFYCYNDYVDEPVKQFRQQLDELCRIAQHCLAKKDISSSLRSDLEIIVKLCEVYKINLGQIVPYYSAIHPEDKLHTYWRSMLWTYPCRHLKPFARQLAQRVDSYFYWEEQMKDVLHTDRDNAQENCFIFTSRSIGDSLFSIISCMILHITPDPDTFAMIREAIKEYDQYTAGRHYRIPLLQRLYEVMYSPEHHVLLSRDHSEHTNVPQSQKSFVGLSLESIKNFSATLHHAQTDFAHVPWTNDEMFLQYLKGQDPMMAVWLDIGLRTLRLGCEL